MLIWSDDVIVGGWYGAGGEPELRAGALYEGAAEGCGLVGLGLGPWAAQR